MKLKLTGCVFILDEIINKNVRKNNQKSIKVLLTEKNENIDIDFDNNSDIKKIIKDKITKIIGSNKFHLEQVYTLGDKRYFEKDKEINIIYLAVTNIQFIKKDLKNYILKEFTIKDNKIILENEIIDYQTKQNITPGGIEYIHNIRVNDLKFEKNLLELLISYKYLKSRIINTDILFKFLPEKFTLDEVKQVYELIGGISVDKSNFRKRIINYIEEVDEKRTRGYRPAKLYCFKVNKNDIWI